MSTKTAMKVKINSKANGQIAELDRQLAETEAELIAKGNELGQSVAMGQVPDALVEVIGKLEARKAAIKAGLVKLGIVVKERTEAERLSRIKAEAEESVLGITMEGIEILKAVHDLHKRATEVFLKGNALSPKAKTGVRVPYEALNFVGFVVRALEGVMQHTEAAYQLSPNDALLAQAGMLPRNGKPAKTKAEKDIWEAKHNIYRYEKQLRELKELRKSGRALKADKDIKTRLGEVEEQLDRARELIKKLGGVDNVEVVNQPSPEDALLAQAEQQPHTGRTMNREEADLWEAKHNQKRFEEQLQKLKELRKPGGGSSNLTERIGETEESLGGAQRRLEKLAQ